MDTNIIREKIKAIVTMPQIKESSKGKHIIFSILQKNKPLLTSDEHLNMLYCYSYCEKALNERRRNNTEMANWYLNKIDFGKTDANEQCMEDMQIIQDPVMSYGLYMDGDYDGAFKHLLVSLKQIDKCFLHSDTSTEFLKAKLEQVLNVFRIFIAEKNIPKATECAKDLMGYLLYQIKKGLFNNQINLTEAIESLGEEWLEMTEYFFNTIIMKYIMLIEENAIKETYFFPDLFRSLMPENEVDHTAPVYKGIALLNDYYTSNTEAFMSKFMQMDINELNAMPLMVKYLIVSKLIQLMEVDSKDEVQQLLTSFIEKNDLTGSLAKIQSKEIFIGAA